MGPGATPHADGISQQSLSNSDVSVIGEPGEQGDILVIAESGGKETFPRSVSQGTRRRFGDR